MKLKRLFLALATALLLSGATVYAQEPEAPAAVEEVAAPGALEPAAEAPREGVGATSNEPPVNWLHYVALLVGGTLVPLGADLLKRGWAKAPPAVKTLFPLIAGSLIAMAEAWLLSTLGEPVDLTMIEQILTGSGLGLAATMAFRKGETHGAAKPKGAR